MQSMKNGSLALFAAVLLAACSVITYAEIDMSQINVNDIQQKLPPELANNLTLDDAKTLLKDKCIQVAGEEQGEQAYQEIETATMTLGECLSDIVNYTAIQAEIDEASPRGELDVVFHKYCKKRPIAITCIETFNSKLVPCLDKEEQANQDVFMRIISSLLNFVCHKGGDQIALFIAEKGPECLESKKEDIQQCINVTYSGYVPKEGLDSIKSLPKFVMGEKQCSELEQLETCIVEKLENCSEITPANIVESMFRFIKNETICRNTPRMAKQAGGKSGASSSTFYGSGSVVFLLTIAVFYSITKRLQA